MAIAAAYAAMHKPDPLTAVAILVKGYHETWPLEEKEVEQLYGLIAMRLCVSVAAAAEKRKTEPENTYLLISEKPAWDLLEKWKLINPQLAHYTFRAACGWEPCPKAARFQQWMAKAEHREQINSLLDADWSNTPFRAMDLSVGSLDLGNNDAFDNIDRFSKTINDLLAEEEVDFGIGGYLEVRPFDIVIVPPSPKLLLAHSERKY